MSNVKPQIKRGRETIISNSCIFGGLKDSAGIIEFGDYCSIHENCRFYVQASFKMGDYGTIHNNSLIQTYKPCTIGHNAWFGQNSIINGTDTLKIGNNFCVGASTKIWTHAFHGELLLGCKVAIGMFDYESKSGAVTIGDDFWGVGQITISPGVKIGNKVLALTNSLITRNVPDNTLLAGIPARPLKIDGDFKAYKNLNASEKFKLMKKFSEQFSKIHHIKIKVDNSKKEIVLGNNEILIHSGKGVFKDSPETTFFDFIKRTYTKRHNHLERKFMEFVLGYRARFVPE